MRMTARTELAPPLGVHLKPHEIAEHDVGSGILANYSGSLYTWVSTVNLLV